MRHGGWCPHRGVAACGMHRRENIPFGWGDQERDRREDFKKTLKAGAILAQGEGSRTFSKTMPLLVQGHGVWGRLAADWDAEFQLASTPDPGQGGMEERLESQSDDEEGSWGYGHWGH